MLTKRKKRPQRVVALQKQLQREMSFKWIVYKFSNLLIKNTFNLSLMKNKGEAHLFLQELSEWHLELHFIFFERHLHFLSMQYLLQWQLTNPCLLPDVITEADRRDSELEGTSCASMKFLSAFLWMHCEHTAAQVGLPSCPTDKAGKSWHQRRRLGHFWELDVLDQGQAPWLQRLSQHQLLKSWVGEREIIFWACCSWPDIATNCSTLIRFFLTQRLQVTFSPKSSLSSL